MRQTRPAEPSGGRRWPLAIGLGLLLIVLVNLAFIYVAVGVQRDDPVAESYLTEPR